MRQRVTADKKRKLSVSDAKQLMFVLGLVILLVLIFLGALILPKQFKVTKIEVEDATPELSQKIKLFSMELINKRRNGSEPVSIFKVPREVLEKELLKQFPLIHTVQILRELPGTVHVTIQEKVPAAVFLVSDKYFLIDPNGIAFGTTNSENVKKNELILVRDEHTSGEVNVGTSIVSTEFLTMLHEVFKQLPDRFNIQIEEATIPTVGTQELDVKTSEGWILKLDTERPTADQFEVLDKVFTEEIDAKKRTLLKYLDLRVKGRGIYMLRSEGNEA